MYKPKPTLFIILLFILCACLLTACGKEAEEAPPPKTTVTMPDGVEIEMSSEYLDLSCYSDSEIDAIIPLFDEFDRISEVNLGSDSNLSAESYVKIAEALPDAHLQYSFSFMGSTLSLNEEALDIRGISESEVAVLEKLLPYMDKLSTVEVGSEEESPISWESFARLTAANRNPAYSYDFTVYGERFNTSDEEIDLRKIPIDDECAALRQVLPCMTKCTYVDLDNCMERGDYTNEVMAQLRDDFPEMEIVWRVYFSYNYSVRTDVETILCSATDPYGDWGLKGEDSTKPLTYCTKVKYLDIGHNNKMTSIEFTRYMPDLEVLIIYHSNVTDLSPLANCKHLRYFEMGMCPVESLEPLSGLTELTDLQMGQCYKLTDLSPLYELNLNRLWLGDTPNIPQEQIDKYRKLHPDSIVSTDDSSVDGSWRYRELSPNVYWPQYAEIREIFNYGENGQGQNFSGFDPYYNNDHDNPPDPEQAARYR